MAAEIIGLTASIVTLSKLTKVAVDVYDLLHDAPIELRQVSEAVIELSLQVPMIKELRNGYGSSSSGVPATSNALNLDKSFELVQCSLERINNSLKKFTCVKSKRSLIRWTLLKKEQTQRLLNDLNLTRSRLITILALSSCLDARHCRSTCGQYITQNQPSSKADNNSASGVVTRPSCSVRRYVPAGQSPSQPWRIGAKGPFLIGCLNAIWITEQHEKYTNYCMSLLLKLPFAYALAASFAIRSGRVGFPSLYNSSLTIKHLVEEDYPFLTACSKGDTAKMQFMLERKLASPEIVTDKGLSPMSMAIRSGKVDAVQLLLNEGVDIDIPFGIRQTSYLSFAIRLRHFEIARLLLSYNACCQSVSGFGWSPIFYLWTNGLDDPIAESAAPFIDLLAARLDFALSHKDILDIGGMGVIHRASVLGQPEDVAGLMRVGVSPFMPQGPLRWTAIQNAVYYNRHDVFKVLLPRYQEEKYDVDTPDTRGWTLLHISASEGHDTITRHLLELGADWQAQTIAVRSDMAEELFGGRWTPAEVALGEGGKADGHRRMDLFLCAVKETHGSDVFVGTDYENWDNDEDEIEIQADVWSDAPEEALAF